MIEYASLTCPHCAHFRTQILPEIKKKWIDTGKVKLIYRDFPLDQVGAPRRPRSPSAPARNAISA